MMKSYVVLASLLAAVCVTGCRHSTPRVVEPTATAVKEHRCGTGRVAVGMTKEDVLEQISGHPAGDVNRQPYHANVSPLALQKRNSFGLLFGTSKHGDPGFLNVYFTDDKVSKIEVIPMRMKN